MSLEINLDAARRCSAAATDRGHPDCGIGPVYSRQVRRLSPGATTELAPPRRQEPPGLSAYPTQVDRLLPPEQRVELETFLRDTQEVGPSLPAWVRPRLARARRIAELTLRASAAKISDTNRRELDELTTGESPEPWSWVKHDAGQPWRQWTDDRVPRTVAEKRHQRQGAFAERAVAGWIGYPAIGGELAAVRPRLIALVEPLALLDQLIVTLVTAHFLGGVSTYPDGSEWPNPFIGAPDEVRALAEEVQPDFVRVLRELATSIETAGVPLDPADPSVHLVLSQLAILRVDLDRPAAEIIGGLNIWSPGFVNREAAVRGHQATWSSRHGRDVDFQRDLDASAEAVAARLGPPPIRPPYAGGHKRRRPTHEPMQEARRSALAKVLLTFPDTNAGELRRTWDAGPGAPGGLLRTKLGLLPHDRPPADTTLRRDLRDIG